jgi:fumarate reductase (CoM/CoB) subunit A
MELRHFTTDVAVIGGGGAACRAAIEAAERGLSCVMVDKGRPGRSGATPCALCVEHSGALRLPGEG